MNGHKFRYHTPNGFSPSPVSARPTSSSVPALFTEWLNISPPTITETPPNKMASKHVTSADSIQSCRSDLYTSLPVSDVRTSFSPSLDLPPSDQVDFPVISPITNPFPPLPEFLANHPSSSSTPFERRFEFINSDDWSMSEHYISPVLRVDPPRAASNSRFGHIKVAPYFGSLSSPPITERDESRASSFIKRLMNALSPDSSASPIQPPMSILHSSSSSRFSSPLSSCSSLSTSTAATLQRPRRTTSHVSSSSALYFVPDSIDPSSCEDFSTSRRYSTRTKISASAPPNVPLFTACSKSKATSTCAAPAKPAQKNETRSSASMTRSTSAITPRYPTRQRTEVVKIRTERKPTQKQPAKRKQSALESPLPSPKAKCARLSSTPTSQSTATTTDANSDTLTLTIPSATLEDTYTTRTFPPYIPLHPYFPLFYRRFPVSSFFQHEDTAEFFLPAATLPLHSGGIYNPPRSAFDLYTPRFCKGSGRTKVGLCGVCLEGTERGGEGRKVWLSMKVSAYKCYHMQYGHGISASSGLPFSPPIAFRTATRPSPLKTEKSEIIEGMCHRCEKWVALQGVKNVEAKVKELFWWKHAALCHQGSTMDGERDIYIEDDAHAHLLDKLSLASV